jgi:hypothetical protein
MTLNASGKISLAGTTVGQSIQVELGGTGTTRISLNDSNVRTLAGVPSGRIVMPTNFYGKSSRVSLSFTFSANTANASLNVSSISGYIAGFSDITVTVNSGVYLYATSTGSPGLALSGGTTGDTITLVNNGFIMGQGGTGGGGPSATLPTAGGPALSLGFNTTINNTNAAAYIGGGGGGGGGVHGGVNGYGGGGGAGGGDGGDSGPIPGGTGGGIGASGASGNAEQNPNFRYGGGGGGRIFPSATTPGPSISFVASRAGNGGSGGGSGGARMNNLGGTVTGGSGGGPATVGGNGTAPFNNNAVATGGGGGWGATGGNSQTFAPSLVEQTGAAGGKAVNLNTYSVTWVSGDTARVYGAVS